MASATSAWICCNRSGGNPLSKDSWGQHRARHFLKLPDQTAEKLPGIACEHFAKRRLRVCICMCGYTVPARINLSRRRKQILWGILRKEIPGQAEQGDQSYCVGAHDGLQGICELPAISEPPTLVGGVFRENLPPLTWEARWDFSVASLELRNNLTAVPRT